MNDVFEIKNELKKLHIEPRMPRYYKNAKKQIFSWKKIIYTIKGHKYKKTWLEDYLDKFSQLCQNHYQWCLSLLNNLQLLPDMKKNVSDWHLVVSGMIM